MKFPLPLALAAAALLHEVAFADDCQRDQAQVIEAAPGQNNSEPVKFSYESRRERYSNTANRYVWCIESDRDNQNVAEFKWGNSKNEDLYLAALIEPGRGTPSIRTDGSTRIRGAREIKFRRKNKPDWRDIDVDTLSSSRIGQVSSRFSLVQVQLTAPANNLALNRFKDDEGLVQIDRLSTDRDAFLAFLRDQGSISSAGSLVVTLPTSAATARLLQSDKYEKYSKEDFVRAQAALESKLSYNGGTPLIVYSVDVKPETNEQPSKLNSIVKDGLVSLRVIPESSATGAYTPFSTERTTIRSFEPVTIGAAKLDATHPVSIIPVRMEVAFGDGPALGSFTATIFTPGQPQ